VVRGLGALDLVTGNGFFCWKGVTVAVLNPAGRAETGLGLGLAAAAVAACCLQHLALDAGEFFNGVHAAAQILTAQGFQKNLLNY
jgi:hypothetical protein